MQTNIDNAPKELPQHKVLNKKYETPTANKLKNNNTLRDVATQFFVDILEGRCFKSIIKTLLWCMTLAFIMLMFSMIFIAWNGNIRTLNIIRSILNIYGLIYFFIIYYILRINKEIGVLDKSSD